MNAKGKLNKTERGAVALGICQELAEKLGETNRKGLDLVQRLGALGYTDAEAMELLKALDVLGFNKE